MILLRYVATPSALDRSSLVSGSGIFHLSSPQFSLSKLSDLSRWLCGQCSRLQVASTLVCPCWTSRFCLSPSLGHLPHVWDSLSSSRHALIFHPRWFQELAGLQTNLPSLAGIFLEHRQCSLAFFHNGIGRRALPWQTTWRIVLSTPSWMNPCLQSRTLNILLPGNFPDCPHGVMFPFMYLFNILGLMHTLSFFGFVLNHNHVWNPFCRLSGRDFLNDACSFLACLTAD